MNERLNRIISFCFIFVSVIILTSCIKTDSGELTELTSKDIQDAKNNKSLNVSGPSLEVVKTFSIYTVDTSDKTIVPVNIVARGGRVTPEFIVEEVKNNMEMDVEITEIEIEKKRLFLSFDHKKQPVKKCDPELEILVLDCFTNSLLDNLSYIDDIIVRCDNGAYSSKNITLGKNEVYLSR